MLDVFSSLRHLLKFRQVRTDSVVFRLHYSLTVCLLIGASLLVSSSQYVGKPIHCAYNKNLFSESYVESFCWVNSTYYHPHDDQRDPLEVAPHVRPGREGDQVQHVKYYQWVAFILFFQAILFYFPRWLWKGFEGGLLERLLATSDRSLMSSETRAASASRLSSYLCQNSAKNNSYMYWYLLCETMAMVNVVVQFFALDWFFDGMFWTYGFRVVKFWGDASEDPASNPMWKVFPRVTKCTLQAFAFNGNVDVIEALCVLPLNVVNEKIFLFLWFWYFLLGCITAGLILYRFVMFVSPKLQQRKFRGHVSFADAKLIDRVFKRTSRGDWFVMSTLAQHTDFVQFADVLYDMDRRMKIGDDPSKPLMPLEQTDSDKAYRASNIRLV